MGTIMYEPLQWFAHNSSTNIFHIWRISIQLSLIDLTIQNILPHPPSLPTLPPPTSSLSPLSLPPCLHIGQFNLMNKRLVA